MANESVVIAIDKINAEKHEVTYVGTGGTLSGSNVLEIRYLKDSWNPGGKHYLGQALKKIGQSLIEQDWPTTS